MAQRLAVAVNQKVDQMRDSNVKQVKAAIKSGSRVLQIGRYRIGGSVCLLVELPSNYPHNIPGLRGLECVISEDKVEETVKWVKANYPTAIVALG